MISSRLRRVEEKNASRRISVAILGMVGSIVFLALFGVNILIGFSVLVDKIRGTSPMQQQPQESLILPPVLDPLPEATHSSTIDVHGKGIAKMTAILFLNDDVYKKVPIAEDGTFLVSDIPVQPGTVTLRAKITDDKDNTSDFSPGISTIIDHTPPKLTIDKPEDNLMINDGTHKVTVNGLTDEDMRVTINGRIVVVKSDGSFTYGMPLNDGENVLTIIAKDHAGNETVQTRKVIYTP